MVKGQRSILGDIFGSIHWNILSGGVDLSMGFEVLHHGEFSGALSLGTSSRLKKRFLLLLFGLSFQSSLVHQSCLVGGFGWRRILLLGLFLNCRGTSSTYWSRWKPKWINYISRVLRLRCLLFLLRYSRLCMSTYGVLSCRVLLGDYVHINSLLLLLYLAHFCSRHNNIFCLNTLRDVDIFILFGPTHVLNDHFFRTILTIYMDCKVALRWSNFLELDRPVCRIFNSLLLLC